MHQCTGHATKSMHVCARASVRAYSNLRSLSLPMVFGRGPEIVLEPRYALAHVRHVSAYESTHVSAHVGIYISTHVGIHVSMHAHRPGEFPEFTNLSWDRASQGIFL